MSTPRSIRRAGDHALLLELASNEAAHAASEEIRDRWGAQLVDVVPGHRTVLVSWESSGVDEAALISFLEHIAGPAICSRNDDDTPSIDGVTIHVTYDGPDLDRVAQTLAMSREQVVELHLGAEYTVAFIGFMPGFPYLIGGDPRLDLPRLAQPRTQVQAGSVAVAAGYCGIYPKAAPGGWNLLGRTQAVLFDARRDPPALLAPGMPVRFRRAEAP